MELRHYIVVIRARTAVIVLVVLAAVGVAYFATPKTHKYSAQAVIYVGAPNVTDPSANALYNNPFFLDRIITTYAKMLDSEPIAGAALAASHLHETATTVVKETTATPVADSQLITVKVEDPSPVVSQRLANAMADTFVQRAQRHASRPRPGSVPSMSTYVFQRADLPAAPAPTGLLRNLLLAGFFGLLVSVGLALLLDHLDAAVKTDQDVERELQLPVLGFIPYSSRHAPGSLATNADVRVAAATRPPARGRES